ncbi:MAG: SDR family NAD(P)-dependent oxidoreductase [Pseudomonadota bacterium]
MSQNIRLFLGASSAVARHMAELYAAEGDALILAGRDTEDLERTASHLALKHKIKASALSYDALDFASHADFIAEVKTHAEGMNLHIIALAAYMPEQAEMDKDIDKALKCINTGYTGLVSVLHPLAAYLEEKRNGSVIIFGSVAGDRGRYGNYIYGSTKAALHCYGAGLRNRLEKSDVHVLTVKPGFIDTVMTRGMKLPPLPIAKPRTVAQNVIKANAKKRNEIYTPFFWWAIMLIIRNIPEFIFKKLKI